MTDTTPAEGLFIDVEVEDSVARDPDLVAELTEVCPVDIFSRDKAGMLEIVRENLDECVLCELCINAAPAGSVIITKLYSGDTLPV